MDTHEFQRYVADAIFEIRGGGKPVTIQLKNGHLFHVRDFVWCTPCDEFHILMGDPK